MKLLVVGGNFYLDGGRASGFIWKIGKWLNKYFETCFVINGGNITKLDEAKNKVKDYDAVLWFPNVPNEIEKSYREIKKVNQKVFLVTSKRNMIVGDVREYNFQELVNHALGLKANMFVEFCKNENGYIESTLYDVLGVEWCGRTTDIESLAKSLHSRISFYKNSVTREGILMCSPVESINVPDENEFFEFVKKCADKFHELILPADGVTRFLGNSSFRCNKGFPSFRKEDMVFMSKRNIDKRYIGQDGFVPVQLKDGKTYCYADCKPSVDTPIQVRLYEFFDYIDYMIHSHVYVKDAKFTNRVYPCGALEEVREIIYAIGGDYKSRSFAVNLLGHGSLIGGWDVDSLKKYEFYARPVPEIV